MSDAPDLTPQEPGVLPGTDSTKLDTLLAGKVGDIVEALDECSDDELVQLVAIETQGKARSTVLGGIAREQQRRLVEAEHPTSEEPALAEKAPLGDDTTYARMHAREIDPSKLTRSVLTKDGWLLPTPKATPED